MSFIEQTLSFVLALFIFAGIIWLAIYLKARHARLKAEKAERLRIEVEPLYQQYLGHLDELRAKHDPEHKWKRHPIAERDLPPAYRADIDALTENFKGVLIIKFGPHIVYPK